jgi:hypothetical protein
MALDNIGTWNDIQTHTECVESIQIWKQRKGNNHTLIILTNFYFFSIIHTLQTSLRKKKKLKLSLRTFLIISIPYTKSKSFVGIYASLTFSQKETKYIFLLFHSVSYEFMLPPYRLLFLELSPQSQAILHMQYTQRWEPIRNHFTIRNINKKKWRRRDFL